MISPAGANLAGRYNLPMLALAAATPAGQKVLATHWEMYTEQLAKHGHPAPERDKWRLVSCVHVAPTRAEAERQVAYGIDQAAKYALRDASFLRAVLDSSGLSSDAPMIDIFRASQLGVIGTPEDVIEHIEHLQELSGGYGTHLIRVLDWANPRDTFDSYELFAREVMPHFQDSGRRREENWDTFSSSEGEFQKALSAANTRARERYEATRTTES